MRRPPPVHEFQPDHTTGRLLGVPAADLGPGRYKNIQQILIGGIIVGAVGFMMINGYGRARRPAYMADCRGRLHILAQAFEMYASDHGGEYPPAAYWRYSLSNYCDAVGGQTRDAEEVRPAAKPRGFSSPMHCLANHSDIAISYFYLDPAELWGADPSEASEQPLLVDEVNHPQVMILNRDSSCRAALPSDWIGERTRTWQIARRPDWRTTFAYACTRPRPATPAATAGDQSWRPPPWEAGAPASPYAPR